MLKHLDYCTHMQFEDDWDILTRKLFDVNIRLFKANESYRRLVIDACNYIEFCCATEKEGYKKPHGYSGANAGIPWNIVGVNQSEHRTLMMINPKIVGRSHPLKEVKSNCGSLTLPEPIKIKRSANVVISYYNKSGNEVVEEFVPDEGSYTIQHEIEHNLGILITDK
jgi:hypothetical protein